MNAEAQVKQFNRAIEVSARWQAAYDAWADGLAASPSIDDLVFDAVDVLGLEDDTIRDTELANFLEVRLDDGIELITVATEAVARLEGTANG